MSWAEFKKQPLDVIMADFEIWKLERDIEEWKQANLKKAK
jgi:hypothetical protein